MWLTPQLVCDPTWIWMLLLPAALSLALLGGVAVYLASERQ